MKKFLGLVAAMMMMTFAFGAMAEAPFEGAWVQFDAGFEIYLPNDWLELEIAEEDMEAGIYYAVCSPDGAHVVQLTWNALDAEYTLEALQAELATAYPDAEIGVLNDISFVGYTDAENDMNVLVALDGEEPGLYGFWFYPASDETFAETGIAIMQSIRLIAE